MRALVSWSGGKDSALALFEVIRSGVKVEALLTTVTEKYRRISMHGVREKLLEEQARSMGIKLEKVFLSGSPSNAEYEEKMKNALEKFSREGINQVVFGDIFLQDVRRYREEKLLKGGFSGIFPLWGKDTRKLAEEFISLGFKAVITCVDTKILPKEFAGRNYDESFLEALPEGIDPCGENGEFHSFVYAGPLFRWKVKFKKGKCVLREGRFYYCDLVPF